MKNRKPIIAVFGSRNGADFAKKIGKAIACQNGIVLTGGQGKPSSFVKEQAILGSMPSPWVGVVRDSCKPEIDRKEGGVIIHTNLEHRRNYLEACLCDGAIGIKNGKGTTSEILFALSLGRPIALVGDWSSPEDPLVIEKMVEAALDLIGPIEPGTPFDGELQESALLKSLKTNSPIFRQFQLDDSMECAIEIGEWILDEVRSQGGIGYFPQLGNYESVAKAYSCWLSEDDQKSV